MWSLGLPGWLHTAEAAALTNVSDTLSDSGPGNASNHTIAFTSATPVTDDDSTLTLTFDALFDLSSIVFTDIDLSDDGADLTIATDCSGAQPVAASSSGQVVTFQFCNGDGASIAASSSVVIEIGTNATSGASGVNQITNPATTTSYAITIGGTLGDTGTARVAIVDQVNVSASVDTTLTFTIAGVGSGQTVNDEPVATVDTTTATSVAFGTVSPGTTTAEFLAQELAVSTNAPGGFTVTVSADQTLTSASSDTIDTFIDGAGTGSSSAWTSPAGTFGSANTYGHWGITSDDDDVGSTTMDYGSGVANYHGNFVNNPLPVMYNNGPSNGQGIGVGTTTVGYKIEITSLQEAGSDYTSTLTYVATPIF